MAVELFVGPFLGTLFEQLRKEVWRAKNNVRKFKSKLGELEETLDLLCPVIEEIEELNRRLNGPDYRGETFALKRLLEYGTELVSKCSKIRRWEILKLSRYKEKLMELENKILRFHSIHLQAHMARDQRRTLLMVKHISMSLNLQAPDLQGYSNLTVDLTASSSSGDSFFKQKIVIRFLMNCQRCRAKALRVGALVNGVEFVGLEGDERENLVCIGVGVDIARLASQLRKKVGPTIIVSLMAA